MLLDDIDKENEAIANKAQQELDNKVLDYQTLLLNEKGQRVFVDLQEQFCMTPSYEPGGSLQDASYYEGQKSVVAYITRLLTYEPRNN